ncbi:nucleotide sugar dehydrogenase [Oceanobacillus jordanicus]
MTTNLEPLIMISETSQLSQYVSQKLAKTGFEITEFDDQHGVVSIILFLFGRQSAKQSNFELLEKIQSSSLKINQLFLIHDKMEGIPPAEELGLQSVMRGSNSTIEFVIRNHSNLKTNTELTGDKLVNQLLRYLVHPLSHGKVRKEILLNETEMIGVVGLGYVGLPVAVGFSEKHRVIGFDVDDKKIAKLKSGKDPSKQFSAEALAQAQIEFTTDAKNLRNCACIVVAVPTPISASNEPDFSYLEAASQLIGENLTPETVVVYESTVYPGATEEICCPILENTSKLKVGKDFFIGYSPERINPGDKEHTFKTIPKVVAGQSVYVTEWLYHLYQGVIEANVYKASSIKVAEAAKVVENTQRDINIAFMNELSHIFNQLNVPTKDVLEAAGTKWNFLSFTPGLVGGHCIGVDPYYLIYKSKLAGYEPNFLTAAREVNESMVDHITNTVMQQIIKNQLPFNNLKITILGATFKENIGDMRNSKALSILEKLLHLGLSVQLCDPHIDSSMVKDMYGISNTPFPKLEKADIVIITVPHQVFNWAQLKNILKEKSIVMDIKSAVPEVNIPDNTVHWHL